MIDLNDIIKYSDFTKNVFEYVKNNNEINPYNKWVYLYNIDINISDQEIFAEYIFSKNVINVYLLNILKYSVAAYKVLLYIDNLSLNDIICTEILDSIIHEVLHANQIIYKYKTDERYIEDFVENPVRSMTYHFCMKYKNDIEDIFNFNIIEDHTVPHDLYKNNYTFTNRYIVTNESIIAANIITGFVYQDLGRETLNMLLTDIISDNSKIKIYIKDYNFMLITKFVLKDRDNIYLDSLFNIYNELIGRFDKENTKLSFDIDNDFKIYTFNIFLEPNIQPYMINPVTFI